MLTDIILLIWTVPGSQTRRYVVHRKEIFILHIFLQKNKNHIFVDFFPFKILNILKISMQSQSQVCKTHKTHLGTQ